MNVRSYLGAIRALPESSGEAMTGGLPFIVLSPHPDDESLGMGGLIASATARGQHAEIVVLTDGAGSHPASRCFPHDRLVALRKAETERAAAELGLPAGRVTHLDLPDTQAPSAGPLFEQAVDRILQLADRAGAGHVFVTWERDPHCDHEAAAAMARALRRRRPGLRLWFYPIWGWHLDPEAPLAASPPRGYRIDISPWLSAKHAAIGAHRSQMTDLIDDDPGGFRFDERTLAPFLQPNEYYFEVPA
ncbi:PIG-L deacetylase family protein [Labrys monachus]|uniref:LmbE family N-acetylglucosaminyl deacetylase n=1 Tax=Labrys monachus TaxID=217067 RepID=A0ABU0FEU6_9HYPH|nr:PIG-L family deacetylase [Labrys monachus]MDQ0392971.1 LmbE family N-acetylglucosaminyl deacetylase [Labrys monachus]